MRVLEGRATKDLPRWAPKHADPRPTSPQGAPMSHDIVIRGARTVLETGIRRADIGIDGERIAAIGDAGSLPQGKREIDAADLVALPGMIDMHSHHREPGFTHKEDLAAIGRQCAAGGVTVSVAMPNVSPPPTTAADLDGMLELYRQRAAFDYNVN